MTLSQGWYIEHEPKVPLDAGDGGEFFGACELSKLLVFWKIITSLRHQTPFAGLETKAGPLMSGFDGVDGSPPTASACANPR